MKSSSYCQRTFNNTTIKITRLGKIVIRTRTEMYRGAIFPDKTFKVNANLTKTQFEWITNKIESGKFDHLTHDKANKS